MLVHQEPGRVRRLLGERSSNDCTTFTPPPQECVDMAAEAGVGAVVLTHLLPEAKPTVDAAHFKGRVIIGQDLDVLVI